MDRNYRDKRLKEGSLLCSGGCHTDGYYDPSVGCRCSCHRTAISDQLSRDKAERLASITGV